MRMGAAWLVLGPGGVRLSLYGTSFRALIAVIPDNPGKSPSPMVMVDISELCARFRTRASLVDCV